MIRARNAWVLAFDNLSALPGWLSDAFCRLATGGGFSTGELHTNDEEVIFDATRPMAFNGIDDFITRADLLERSLLMRHPPIRAGRRPAGRSRGSGPCSMRRTRRSSGRCWIGCRPGCGSCRA